MYRANNKNELTKIINLNEQKLVKKFELFPYQN